MSMKGKNTDVNMVNQWMTKSAQDHLLILKVQNDAELAAYHNFKKLMLAGSDIYDLEKIPIGPWF